MEPPVEPWPYGPCCGPSLQIMAHLGYLDDAIKKAASLADLGEDASPSVTIFRAPYGVGLLNLVGGQHAAFRMPTADELANGVNANCEVMIEGYTYSGPCKFDSPGGASFGVARADGYPMSSQFEEIYVEADTRTDGFGRFRDGDGNWQDMGILTRANTRDACWTGDLTKVCAYGKKF